MLLPLSHTTLKSHWPWWVFPAPTTAYFGAVLFGLAKKLLLPKYSNRVFPFFYATLLVPNFVLHSFHSTVPGNPNIAEELDLATQVKLQL